VASVELGASMEIDIVDSVELVCLFAPRSPISFARSFVFSTFCQLVN